MTFNEFRKSHIGSLLALVIIFTVFYFTQKSCYENVHRRIVANAAFGDGYVYEISNSAKHGWTALYNFQPDIDLIWGHKNDKVIEKLKSKLIYHHFPVIYNKENPDENAILITPEDFESFAVPYPDSLNWVKSLIE